MQISFFSADLKLVTPKTAEDPGFRVLEFNDGLRSGFTGYDALGGGRMITDKVFEDYAGLFPGVPVVHPASQPVSADQTIVFPRTDELIKYMTRIEMMLADALSAHQITVNSYLPFHALTENKGYQYFMAEQMGEAGASLFPPSAILMNRFIKGAADELSESKNGYVLKPLAMLGGTGLRLIDHATREPALKRLLRNPYLFHRDIWMGAGETACLLQHKVEANEVETQQGSYDGTMRVAFTVYGDTDNLQCYIHDAYWKLPKKTITEDAGLESVVSFSPSNFDRKNPRLYKVFLSAASSVYGITLKQEEPKQIISAPVAQAVKDDLFPALQNSFRRYFQHAAQADLLEDTRQLLASGNKGHMGLGVMMALHPYYYPPADKNRLDSVYPALILDTLKKSTMLDNTAGYLFQRLNNFQMKGHHPECDHPHETFSKPLREILDNAVKADMMNGLSEVMLKAMSMMPRFG